MKCKENVMLKQFGGHCYKRNRSVIISIAYVTVFIFAIRYKNNVYVLL